MGNRNIAVEEEAENIGKESFADNSGVMPGVQEVIAGIQNGNDAGEYTAGSNNIRMSGNEHQEEQSEAIGEEGKGGTLYTTEFGNSGINGKIDSCKAIWEGRRLKREGKHHIQLGNARGRQFQKRHIEAEKL